MRAEFGSHHEVAEIFLREDGGARRGLLVADDAVHHTPDLHLIGWNDELIEALAVEQKLEALLLLRGGESVGRAPLLCRDRRRRDHHETDEAEKYHAHGAHHTPRQPQRGGGVRPRCFVP